MPSKKKVIVIDQKDMSGKTLGGIIEAVTKGNCSMKDVVLARLLVQEVVEDAKNLMDKLDGFVALGGVEKAIKELKASGELKEDEVPVFVGISRKAKKEEDGTVTYGAGEVKSVKGITITESTTISWDGLKKLPIETVDPSLTVTKTVTTTELISRAEMLKRREAGLIPAGYDKYFVENTISKFGSDETTARKTAADLGLIKK